MSRSVFVIETWSQYYTYMRFRGFKRLVRNASILCIPHFLQNQLTSITFYQFSSRYRIMLIHNCVGFHFALLTCYYVFPKIFLFTSWNDTVYYCGANLILHITSQRSARSVRRPQLTSSAYFAIFTENS